MELNISANINPNDQLHFYSVIADIKHFITEDYSLIFKHFMMYGRKRKTITQLMSVAEQISK
jgi:hypothetical protein